MKTDINLIVENAQRGDANALRALIEYCQNPIHRLATRMIVDTDLVLDVTQEILIRVITNLSSFRHESQFDSWVYRIALNYLLTARKMKARDPHISFDDFSSDLLDGLQPPDATDILDNVLLNQLRIKCTMAMLICLDRKHRAAYILGDILEFDHREAAAILEIQPATFRKQLSRARAAIINFTQQHCGLANKQAPCSCEARLPKAAALGRITQADPNGFQDAPAYDQIQKWVQQTHHGLSAIKLQRATGKLNAPEDFAQRILSLVDPPG